jgi:hypothetical protein
VTPLVQHLVKMSLGESLLFWISNPCIFGLTFLKIQFSKIVWFLWKQTLPQLPHQKFRKNNVGVTWDNIKLIWILSSMQSFYHHYHCQSFINQTFSWKFCPTKVFQVLKLERINSILIYSLYFSLKLLYA